MKKNKALSFENHHNMKLSNISPLNKFISKNNISPIKNKNKNKNKEKLNKTEKINTKEQNIFLTQNNLSRSLEKIYKNKNKIKFIKKLLTPTIKTYIFDGYAVNRKKFSFRELINKVSKKEKKEMFEKNILFKSPYPLIKFLSNRKLYNNSSSLITELLDYDSSKLTKEQLLTINKKDENRTFTNISRIKNINSNKNNNKYQHNFSNSYNHLDKKNLFFNYIKDKNSKKINLKKNIRLHDYLNTKYHLFKFDGAKTNFNNKFINYNCNQGDLPLLTKYNNDKVENKNIFNMKNKPLKINKTENKVYLNDELFNFQLNTFNFSHNNSSIKFEDDENTKYKNSSNSIFFKKNKKYISKKV